MRAWVLFVALLVAAGVLFFVLWEDGPAGNGRADVAPGAPGDAGPERAPELLGAGEGRPHVPVEIRGSGSIQGTVRRADHPVEADVELRHVTGFDPENPLGGGVFQMMIERVLDAGVSTKEVSARTRSGADGAYGFGRLAPGLYEVRAIAADGAVGFASAALPAHGARVEASVRIPEGGERLVGRVLFADGKPFRGLVVALGGEGFALVMGGSGERQPAWTDDEGRFVLSGLAPGRIRLSAAIPGVMRVIDAPITLPYAGEYVLQLDAGGEEASGRVISAATEEPIAGATVFAGGGEMETRFSIRTTRTDEDGRFALLTPPGQGGLFARAPGYAPQDVQFRETGRTGLVISLRALGRITGRIVTRDDGTPVAGVYVIGAPEGGRGMPVISTGLSDAGGRYVLGDVVPGAVRLVAQGAGWVSPGAASLRGLGQGGPNPNMVQVEPGGEATLDIEVTAGARAQGRVTTAAGDPVAGCVVRSGSGSGMPGPAALLMGIGLPLETSVTDTEGRYVLDTLVPEQEYSLSADAPGQPEARAAKFKAVAGKTHEIDLRFPAARWLDLHVVGAADGQPVGGAAVRVVPDEGDRDVFDLAELLGGDVSHTDASGHVRLGPLPDGKLAVQVKAAGYIEKKDVELAAGGPADLALTVELARGLVIAGRVALPAGMPAQGVRVTIRTEWSRSGDRDWLRLSPPVDVDGGFRVDTLPDDGKYRVEAQAYWRGTRYGAVLVVDGGEEEVRLELKPREERERGSSLTVRVVDHEGDPVASARIQLYTFEGDRSSSSSEQRLSSGAATFRGVETDREMWVEVWQVVGGERGATIHGPLPSGTTEAEVRLPAAFTVAGTVVGPDGKPVRGVRVTAHALHPSRHRELGEEHGVGFSDVKGRFVLKGLGDLDYRLSFLVPTDYAPAPYQEVRAGVTDLRISLRGGVAATLGVVDAEGAPVAGAAVYLDAQHEHLAPGGRPVALPAHSINGRTDAEGRFTARGLAADGLYRLRVQPPDGRADLREEMRVDWTPRDETVTLRRAYRISGLVKDQHGKPVPDCRVQHRPVGEERWSGSVQTDDAGRFVIEKLARGEYELHAFVPGVLGSDPARPEAEGGPHVVAGAGDAKVVLRVDLGASLAIRVRDYDAGGGRAGLVEVVPRFLQAQLRTETPPIREVRAQLDAQGRVRFRGLQAGRPYTLAVVGLPGGRYALVRGLQAGEREVEVEARKGGSVRGRLVTAGGGDVDNAFVSLVSPEGVSTGVPADRETGAFRIDGLPGTTWEVRATAWVNGKRCDGQAQVATGGEVEIRLVER